MVVAEDLVGNKLEECDNIFLEVTFTEVEVRAAIWACASNKSPGPDGFTFAFFKNCWEIIKKDVMAAMEEFHRNGKLVTGLNTLFVVLIPKKDGSNKFEDFRPISLVGSIYKIISKILARRLAKVMDPLISENQAAFVGRRQILDGIVILNEIVDEARRKKISRFVFKADFAKAYDSVEWNYLEEMMVKMNFGRKWCNWVMECVRTASISVLINGSPSGDFRMERGLRQGDPLSPFLYLIAAEGLSLLMKKAVEVGLVESTVIGGEGVMVSHLQFADDTIFTCSGKYENIRAIKQILRNFELLSGLRVNLKKCCLIGMNIEEEVVSNCANYLDCSVGKLPLQYLGMQVGLEHKKSASCNKLIQKVKGRLDAWNDKNISLGGRATLVQSVLSTIPIYSLSMFQIPKKTVGDLIQIQRNFLWGGCASYSKIPWVRRGEICKEKKQGGLGIKDLGRFNIILLKKWIWRFLNEPGRLWVRALKAKYGGFVKKRERGRPRVMGESSVCRWGCVSGWRKDISNLYFGSDGRGMSKELVRVVGEGRGVSFWDEPWCEGKVLRELFPRLYRISDNKQNRISEVGRWENEEWRWELTWIRNLRERDLSYVNELLNCINRVKLKLNTEDYWSWTGSSKGIYNTGAAYRKEQEENGDDKEQEKTAAFKGLWKTSAPRRVQAIVWKILKNRLPTRMSLQRRGVIDATTNIMCPICLEEEETIHHLFFKCPIATKVWTDFYK